MTDISVKYTRTALYRIVNHTICYNKYQISILIIELLCRFIVANFLLLRVSHFVETRVQLKKKKGTQFNKMAGIYSVFQDTTQCIIFHSIY